MIFAKVGIEQAVVSCHMKLKSFSDSSDGWIKYLQWEDEQLTGDVMLRKRRRYCLLAGTGTSSSSCLFEEQGRFSMELKLVFLLSLLIQLY